VTRYKAILFAPDGDWVTDYRDCKTIAEVEDKLADQGSRWYFYQFHGVIVDHGPVVTRAQRLVSCAPPFSQWKGCRISTLSKVIEDLTDDELRMLIGG